MAKGGGDVERGPTGKGMGLEIKMGHWQIEQLDAVNAHEAGAEDETREAALRDLRRGAKQKTALSSFPSRGAARAWISLEQRMGRRRDGIGG